MTLHGAAVVQILLTGTIDGLDGQTVDDLIAQARQRLHEDMGKLEQWMPEPHTHGCYADSPDHADQCRVEYIDCWHGDDWEHDQIHQVNGDWEI